jgi:TPR repeat protein
VRWYELGASESSWSQYNLAECYFIGSGVEMNRETAVKYYRLSAAQSNAWALNKLGDCFLNGHGVTADANEALRWYRLAMKQNNSKSIISLGKFHSNHENKIMAGCLLNLAKKYDADAQANNFRLSDDERMIVDALLEEGMPEGGEIAREIALEWLCMQHSDEIEYITKHRSSYKKLVEVLNTLPLPIAEEIIPNMSTAQ